MYRIFLFFLLCAYAVEVKSAFKDCGSKVGHYTSISVSDCPETKQSCVLKRGTNATIEIQFDIDNQASAVKAVVHGIVAGLPVPFGISHPDACKDSGLTCPLVKEKGPYTYSTTLFVERTYPKLSLTVKWELKDEAGNDIVCVEIPAKIQ